MPLQYILDEAGKKTAAIVPIEEWEALIKKHQDLGGLENPPKSAGKLADLFGKISEAEAAELDKQLKQSRQEWSRDI